MANHTASLTLKLRENPELDIQSLSRQLRDSLLDNPEIESADQARINNTSPGEKSGGVIDWNTLLLTLVASGSALTVLIQAIQSFVANRQNASVSLTCGEHTLTIEGKGPYSKAQQRAIDLWLGRCKGFVLPHE